MLPLAEKIIQGVELRDVVGFPGVSLVRLGLDLNPAKLFCILRGPSSKAGGGGHRNLATLTPPKTAAMTFQNKKKTTFLQHKKTYLKPISNFSSNPYDSRL